MEAKKRKARFSAREIDVLVGEVFANRSTLFSRLCNTVSNERKMTVWQSITESVNAVCAVEPRTPEEVRRKWYYYLSDKKKELLLLLRRRDEHRLSRKTRRRGGGDDHDDDDDDDPLLARCSPSDLKVLELLSEIEAAGKGSPPAQAAEGLVCEVDADAVRVRPSSSASDVDSTPPRERQELMASARQQELVSSKGDSPPANGLVAPPNIKKERHETSFDTYRPLLSNSKRRKRRSTDDDSEDDEEEEERGGGGGDVAVRLERRRLRLQEEQVQILKDMYEQMREDSQRNHSFQQAFLDIQRQRLELERAATQKYL